MKTLHVLRHGKSDWSDTGLDDHDRPLNKRGKESRKLVAAHVKGWKVDLVVCSTARRTRDTVKPVVKALGCPIRYDDAVYNASVDGLLTLARDFPDVDQTVMLVGHNPSMEELTELLCGSSPAYPTAALGSITLAIDHWHEIAPNVGTLAAFVTPDQLHGLP